MKIEILTRNDCAETVQVDYSPAEWLIVNKAMRQFSNNRRNHPVDVDFVNNILSCHPVFKEVEK